MLSNLEANGSNAPIRQLIWYITKIFEAFYPWVVITKAFLLHLSLPVRSSCSHVVITEKLLL